MKLLKHSLAFLLPVIGVSAFVSGCGGASDKKISEIEGRIKALEAKGVPDSVLSNIKVYTYNVATGKKAGNMSTAIAYTDSMIKGIKIAEDWYTNTMASYKPAVESLKSSLAAKKSNLSGLQLRAADSMLAIVDSFVKIDWLIQAKSKLCDFDTMMTDLQKCEKTAAQIKKVLPGTWTDIHKIKSDDGKYSATEKRIYKFGADGSYNAQEEMKGQTMEYFKEDWQFVSSGTYDLKGDTIRIYITKEKCPHQVYTQFNMKEKRWIEQKKPTYDSTITNHSKDKFMTFKDMREVFKKSK
jgi:hypothetical protein